MRVGDYELHERIHASTLSVVHRARRVSDGCEVFVKTPARPGGAGDLLAQLRHELLVCRMFAAPSLIRAIELIESESTAALVLESVPNSVTLSQRAAAARLSTLEAVEVALGILDGIATLHGRNVVHKDIKPDNVLVDRELTRVVLIDFGIAAIVPRDAGSVAADARLEGTLGYMPPEQTGRINRPIDYRSDYYALGATLFWMLTGEPPFGALLEPEALVHAHIAKVPRRLDEPADGAAPAVPPALARIVAKLLSKAADERYQGAFGLRADLLRCADELAAGSWPDFAIASVDPTEQLRVPHPLYGREPQLEQLRRALADAESETQVVVLAGAPGVGKTSLARELLGSLEPDRTVVTSGFSRQPGAESSGVAALLRGLLVEQLDAERRSDALELRIREALGRNAGLLAELVPELEKLLGPQPPVAAVGPGQARDRFFDTLARLVRALLLPERRYVLFVDDLQWADEAGARTLEALAVEQKRGVLLVLALRDEVLLAPQHPAATLLARMRVRGRAPIVLRLEPLARAQVIALVEQTLANAPGSRELAELLHQRSHGTPLFVAQLLHSFYVEGIVDVDRTSGRWCVDLDAARRSESRGDVIDYLIARFAELPAQTRRLLGVAACFGSSFELAQLAAVAGEPVNDAILEAAAAAYLLTVSAGRAQVGGRATTPGGSAIEYRFAHDRLRQLALDATPEPREPLHLAIARTLCASILGAEQLSRVAEHIGRAVPLVDDPHERAQFGAICETAGVLAKSSAAYHVAARHFETALRLLSDQPAAQLSIALELGECLAMSGRIEAADEVFAHARSLVVDRAERAQLLMLREQLAIVRIDCERALAIVSEAAELFQLDLRRSGSQAWFEGLLASFMPEFAQLTPERVATLPKIEDPERRHLLQLLSAATYPAYIAGDLNLYFALLIAAIRETLAHGLCDVIAPCFVQLGILFATSLRDHEVARRCAALGIQTIERFPGSPVEGQVELIYHGTYQFLLEPLGESIPALSDAHRRLRAVGALLPAGYALCGRLAHELIIGAPLSQVASGAEQAVEYLAAIPNPSHERLARFYAAWARALAQGTAHAAELRPPGFSSDQQLFAEMVPTPVFLIQAMRAYLCLLLGDRVGTAAALREAEPLARGAAMGQLPPLWFELVRVLHGCEVFTELDAERAELHRARVEALLITLGRWETSCPSNATPLRCLVGGAWALARGELEPAVEALTVAADAAAAVHFHNVEGLACELAARALLALGRRRHATGYLGDALQAYGRWGALPLQRRVRDALRERGLFSLTSSGATSSLAAGGEPGKLLDVASVVKMSQAMLEATKLEQVIGRLLAAITENAGADRCVLLLDEDDGLRIRAERRATGELYLLDEGLRVASSEQLLARSLVLASARSNEPVLVDDALRDPRCARDPYVRAEQVRALLLLPVFTGSRRVGLLYLENRLTPGAFTAHRVQLATTLAAQAAVSIENARLFEALREGEAQWRAVVEGAPDFIVMLDRRRRVEFINRVAYGLEPKQVIGKAAEQFLALEERPRMIAATDFVFETGLGTSYESRIETPIGVRRFTTRIGPVIRDGEVQRVVLIATDVTEQHQLEAELRHSQKMQAVGTLAGGIAHDFNNLLTVILGACDLCSMIASDNQPLQAGLREITEAATRAASLTRQLLAYSRKQTLQPKRFDLGALVGELTSMLTRLLGDGVTLTLALAEQPCLVYADPTQFSQVLVNLAVNARDAMPDGGLLRVRVGSDAAGKIVLEVSDTGVGMDEELIRHIFEPFFTTKTEGQGTGLGLSTVLGIVEQSGGRVEVDSELGRGSCFRITLPSADEVEGGPSSRAATLPRGSETVLLVEHDLALQRLAARLLELQGYQVRTAATGEQALAIAAELGELDLLITDVVMPGASGAEVAQLVLREHPNAKVLYLASESAEELAQHQLAPLNLLTKPFTREGIATMVRAILDHASA